MSTAKGKAENAVREFNRSALEPLFAANLVALPSRRG